MGSDESDERREQRFGRRQADKMVDFRLAAAEDVLKALAPAVAQVARIDDAVADLEKWIADERAARRQHFTELLESVREIRVDTARELTALREEIRSLKLDQRSGRRALIGSMIGAAATIVVALIGAAALVATHT